MKAVFCFLMAVLLATVAFGTRLEEARVPASWQSTKAKAGELNLDRKLQMTLALRRRNMDKLEKLFWEVSDPQNANYGDHLKHEQMRKLISAGPKALVTVTGWLRANGINDYTVSRHEDSIAFDATEAQVEKLLSVKFTMFENKVTKQRAARAVGAMEVPSAVANAVEVFAGHRGFPLPKKSPKKVEVRHAESMETNVTPALLYKVYNQSYFPSTPSGQKNIQSFFQAQGQYVEPSDLKTFCKMLDPTLKDCKIEKYIGPNQGSQPGVESSLDSEYITATGHGTETWVYSYSNFDFCGDLIRWGQDVLSEKNGTFPWVISMSYGAQSLPNYCMGPDVDRLAKDVMKMGAMGITVVIASGDEGSGEDARAGYNYGLLGASMPAVIPYATAVGSTTFISGNSGEEKALVVPELGVPALVVPRYYLEVQALEVLG